MKTRLIIDEDSVYEIDEECIRKKEEQAREEVQKKKKKSDFRGEYSK